MLNPYNYLGSYLKNTNSFGRRIGFEIRKSVLLGEYIRRKRAAVATASQGFYIDREKGFSALNGFSELEYRADVIELVKTEFMAQKDNIDFSVKGHLYTGLLDKHFISEDSVLLKFILQKTLLDPIINYFGFVPVLSYIGAWFSPGKKKTLSDSQLFHCDQADVRQVKVFVYCSDVSSSDGPLTLIPASGSNELRSALGYCWSDKDQCIADEVAEQHISRDKWIEMTGNEGDMFLCDTSRCFHFGSRLSEQSRERLVLVFQFTSPFAFMLPINFRHNLPFAHLEGENFDEVECLVLGL